MAKITSLADEIRNKIASERTDKASPKRAATQRKPVADVAIIKLIATYDNSGHKSMVHVRFDEQTVRTLNHFKMATGIDVTKLVAFSVQELFKTHPELKSIIKQFIQNVSL